MQYCDEIRIFRGTQTLIYQNVAPSIDLFGSSGRSSADKILNWARTLYDVPCTLSHFKIDGFEVVCVNGLPCLP